MPITPRRALIVCVVALTSGCGPKPIRTVVSCALDDVTVLDQDIVDNAALCRATNIAACEAFADAIEKKQQENAKLIREFACVNGSKNACLKLQRPAGAGG